MHVKEADTITDISQFSESCVEYNPLVNRNESELIGQPVKITIAVNTALNNGEYIVGFAKNEVQEQEAAESKEFADRVSAELGEQPSTLTEHVGNVLTWTGTTITIYNMTEYKPIEGDIITVYGIYDGYTDEVIDSGAPTISCVAVDCCDNINT